PPCGMPELIIVSNSNLQTFLVRQSNEFLRLGRVDGKGLFHVDVTSFIQALPCDCKMALRRGRNMDHIWTALLQEFGKVTEIQADLKSLGQLLRHQFLEVIDCDNPGVPDPQDL